MSKETGKRFWVAHVRGPDFARLRKIGFVVLYPILDDYVFLEVNPMNLRQLSRQTELGIFFLKDRKGLVTISQEELDKMSHETTKQIQVGSEILVVAGPYENLEGVVKEDFSPTKIVCELQGYNRTYTVEVDRLHVVLRTDDEAIQAESPDEGEPQ